MPAGGRVKVLTAEGVCTFPTLSGKHCSVESKVKARVAGSNLGLVGLVRPPTGKQTAEKG